MAQAKQAHESEMAESLAAHENELAETIAGDTYHHRTHYAGLVDEQGRSAALRKVQREMASSDERSHPYYWAAFIASGRWDPMRFDFEQPEEPEDDDALAFEELARYGHRSSNNGAGQGTPAGLINACNDRMAHAIGFFFECPEI